MKLKDYIFKSVRFSRTDNDGYNGCLDVYTLCGRYIAGLRYNTREMPDSEYSKKSAKKKLISIIIKHEADIKKQLKCDN